MTPLRRRTWKGWAVLASYPRRAEGLLSDGVGLPALFRTKGNALDYLRQQTLGRYPGRAIRVTVTVESAGAGVQP